jgi:hypothetical protein
LKALDLVSVLDALSQSAYSEAFAERRDGPDNSSLLWIIAFEPG